MITRATFLRRAAFAGVALLYGWKDTNPASIASGKTEATQQRATAADAGGYLVSPEMEREIYAVDAHARSEGSISP